MIAASAPAPARTGAAFAVLAALVAALAGAALSLGSAPIPILDAAASLLGRPLADPVWEGILWEIRLPRCLAALLAGSSLAVSGLLMQTLFRNPLAGPYSLGVSSGAARVLFRLLSARRRGGEAGAWSMTDCLRVLDQT